MADDEELDQILQKTLLNLHDAKPQDPIRFLADYFSSESEDDPLAAAINLFDSLTVFHPITEERIMKCYDILSAGEFEGVLVGFRYNNFIQQLVMRLPVPLELAKPILNYLDREMSSVISCQMLRRAILTVLLYKQYFEEMYSTFEKIILCPNVAPAYKCEDLLMHASTCLKRIHDIPRKYPYTLGIPTFCNPECRLRRSSSTDSICDEFWNITDFVSAATETYFHEIDDLSLSRLCLADFGCEKEEYIAEEYKYAHENKDKID